MILGAILFSPSYVPNDILMSSFSNLLGKWAGGGNAWNGVAISTDADHDKLGQWCKYYENYEKNEKIVKFPL